MAMALCPPCVFMHLPFWAVLHLCVFALHLCLITPRHLPPHRLKSIRSLGSLSPRSAAFFNCWGFIYGMIFKAIYDKKTNLTAWSTAVHFWSWNSWFQHQLDSRWKRTGSITCDNYQQVSFTVQGKEANKDNTESNSTPSRDKYLWPISLGVKSLPQDAFFCACKLWTAPLRRTGLVLPSSEVFSETQSSN